MEWENNDMMLISVEVQNATISKRDSFAIAELIGLYEKKKIFVQYEMIKRC